MQVSALFAILVETSTLCRFERQRWYHSSTGKGNLPATASAAGDAVSLANLSDR